MALLRVDNTGIVFDDLDAGVAFSAEMGIAQELR